MDDTKYLDLIASTRDTIYDKHSYLNPSHPDQWGSVKSQGSDNHGVNYNTSWQSSYEQLRAGSDGTMANNPAAVNKTGDYLTTTAPSSGNSSVQFPSGDSSMEFSSGDSSGTTTTRQQLRLPRVPRPNEKFFDLPPYQQFPSSRNAACRRGVIATVVIILVLCALGGAAYGIYYAVSQKSNFQLVLVYGEMNYTDTDAVREQGFQENLVDKMDSSIRDDSAVSPYYKSSSISDIYIDPRNTSAIVEFVLNFHLDKTKTNHGGLFGALEHIITTTVVTSGMMLKCLTIIPEKYNTDVSKYDCGFNITDFTDVLKS